MANLYVRVLCLTAMTALAACGGESASSETPAANDESELVSSLQGNFQTEAPASARMRPGYLYRIDISPPSNGRRYATVYVVADLCGTQRADGTCDRAWIDANPKSLDRYWNDLTVSTSRKTIALTYETDNASGGDSVENNRKWGYKIVGGGLELTESKPGARPFGVKRLATHKVSAAVKHAFESWMENEVENDTSAIDGGPSVAIASLPLAAQRSAYMYEHEWTYGTDATKVTVAGTTYYSLSQQNDGGGKYLFFTLAGEELGSYGGSESGEWDFDWNEY